MKIIAISIILLGQIVCIGTILSSCSQKSINSEYGSNHTYYKKDLKKLVLSSNVHKCTKLSK